MYSHFGTISPPHDTSIFGRNSFELNVHFEKCFTTIKIINPKVKCTQLSIISTRGINTLSSIISAVGTFGSYGSDNDSLAGATGQPIGVQSLHKSSSAGQQWSTSFMWNTSFMFTISTVLTLWCDGGDNAWFTGAAGQPIGVQSLHKAEVHSIPHQTVRISEVLLQ